MNKTERCAFTLKRINVETAGGSTELSILVCDELERAGFLNGFSTRVGGTSPLPSAALNLGYCRADSRENVDENRRRFLEGLGSDKTTLVTARQTHSREHVTIASPKDAKGPEPAADAMITGLVGVLLGVQTADCLPILIADPQTGTVAAIHAGWRGTADRITERTIAGLMSQGVNPRNCLAALGPNACGDCYKVRSDVSDRFKQEFGYWRELFTGSTDEGTTGLDIRAANVQQLLFCGFSPERTFVADYCTMHQNHLFFSYRREAHGKNSKVGRMLSVIGRN
jgi:YfiH family protein